MKRRSRSVIAHHPMCGYSRPADGVPTVMLRGPLKIISYRIWKSSLLLLLSVLDDLGPKKVNHDHKPIKCFVHTVALCALNLSHEF